MQGKTIAKGVLSCRGCSACRELLIRDYDRKGVCGVEHCPRPLVVAIFRWDHVLLLLRVTREREWRERENCACYSRDWTWVVCVECRACVRPRVEAVDVPPSHLTLCVRPVRYRRLTWDALGREPLCGTVLREDGCDVREYVCLEEDCKFILRCIRHFLSILVVLSQSRPIHQQWTPSPPSPPSLVFWCAVCYFLALWT